MSPAARQLSRLLLSLLVAGGLVATALAMPSAGGRSGDLLRRYDATKRAAVSRHLESQPHTHQALAVGHVHNDPATKNLVSRAGETGPEAQDPTTRTEKAAHAAYVAQERRLRDPRLTTVRLHEPRRTHPQDRYVMANGCYTLTAASEPLYFKPTTLGTYLLYDAERRFVTTSPDGSDQAKADAAGPDTEWTARTRQGRLTFRNGDTTLRHGSRTAFRPTLATGCATYPEAQVNVHGRPFAGVSPFQEVRGYLDAHTHGMAFEFLGGAHCGKPWDRYGVDHALVDCPDHQTGTNPLEAFLSGNPTHDPVGWPTFKDWPAPESLTHEGTYYKWLERSWRSGQRLFVNLLVENNQLCRVYPFKRDGLSDVTCDEMESLERQAEDMYALQDYVDAQWGGPGKGWYRIVKNPFQARRVINQGKLAVVMGIETSVPFGCTFKATGPLGGDVPACSADSIDAQLAEVHRWGVRQMELVNKFDNALAGVAGDAGETGLVVNNANKLETGTYWDMEHCEPANPDAHDKNQLTAPDIDPEQQDALFGAIGKAFDLPLLAPAYPPVDHCNSRGLTDLGAHLVGRMAQRHMLIDPDHLSVKARDTLLDQVEALQYPGILSSHSWSTEDAYPRIYQLGGFIAPYAGDSTGFVDKWRAHVGWADPRYYFGIGYGADINGLGAQGDPRGADVPNPVTYPFTGMGGVRIDQQHAGQRVYDINTDGVAQYGLYPDWIQDLREVADASEQHDGDAIFEDLSRGPEAYLQMWERATGIAPDSCRNPDLRKSVARVKQLVRPGMTTRQVMEEVGQPYTRLGRRFGICATRKGDDQVRVTIRFTPRGRVLAVRA